MHRPDSEGVTVDGRFTDGDPSLSVPRTTLRSKYMNAVTDEVCGVVAQAGLALSDIDNSQIIQSVTLTVATIAALRLCPVPSIAAGKKVAVWVRGNAADGDGVGTLFYWSYNSTAADDGVAVVRPSTNPASGRWLRAPVGYATSAGSANTATTATNASQLGGVAAASYATQSFVNAAIAALVASSPAALDTLNELAAALGNDANFATTMTNALAAKAPLASPNFTGTPSAPTPATSDNSTHISTTEWMRNLLSNGVVLSTSGVAPMQNGWVIQTLNVSVSAGSDGTSFSVTWPQAFLNQCVAPLAISTGAGLIASPTARSVTGATFSVVQRSQAAYGASQLLVVALGY